MVEPIVDTATPKETSTTKNPFVSLRFPPQLCQRCEFVMTNFAAVFRHAAKHILIDAEGKMDFVEPVVEEVNNSHYYLG